MARYFMIFAVALLLALPTARAQPPGRVQATNPYYTPPVIDPRPVPVPVINPGPVTAEARVTYTLKQETTVVRQVNVGVERKEEPLAFCEGRVMRMAGDQVVLRTMDNKEVTVQVQPRTEYTFNDEPATFVDLMPGSSVRVEYEMHNNQSIARLVGIRERR
jgi:hypothetical protein